MYLKRLNKTNSKILEDLTDVSLILELYDGSVYGGNLEDYFNGEGVIQLYHCEKLNENNIEWSDHDRLISYEGKEIHDIMPNFDIDEIENILMLPEELIDKYSLYDVLQIYIDPYYKPIDGIECRWRKNINIENEPHSFECNSRLHESLVNLYTNAHMGVNSNETNILTDDFNYIRRLLLRYQEKIP